MLPTTLRKNKVSKALIIGQHIDPDEFIKCKVNKRNSKKYLL